MSCFKHTCIILIALSSSLKCCSQERNFTANKNKAIEDLKQYTHRDTARANALINILRQARFKKEYPQVLPYYEEAFLLSKQLGYSEGLARCYMFKAFQARAYLEHKTAVDNFDSAIIVLKHTATPVAAGIKADAFQFKGRTFHDMSNYYEALLSYLEALKYFETRNTEKTSILYFNIANISLNLNNYAQALSYAKKNYTLCLEQLKKQSHVFESHMQMADVHIQLKEYDQAETYVNKATAYLPANEFRHATLYNLYLKKGQVHYYQARYPEALQDLEMAKLNADSSGHTANKAATLKWLSETAMKMNRNELALHYAQQAFALVNDMPRNMIKQETMHSLAFALKKNGQYLPAFNYLDESVVIKDSIITEKNLQQINQLVAIYETEKKQQEIVSLQLEKEKQVAAVKRTSTLNTIYVISITALLILGYLGFLNLRKNKQLARQQQQLQQQQIAELEKNKQLLTADAMLKGQEEERSRIAKDLHDGLGGLLSGTKLSFMNIRENLVLSQSNAQLFEQSLNMLDQTINDLRKVAHNLMPEALVKFGLNEAVKDFCSTIRQSSGINIVYQVLGEERKHHNTAAVFIYRIIQELVNNAVKHASASQIMVQLAIGSNNTEITVEDNGKGFNKSLLQQTQGAGMANIQYRVQYFNGTIDMNTEPGKGTSVYIELKA